MTHWIVRNTSHDALRGESLDFSASSLGVEEEDVSGMVAAALHLRRLPTDYILPSTSVSGDSAFQVLNGLGTIEVRFTPASGNMGSQTEVWTIKR